MTTNTDVRSFGLLHTLSPEMARDLGEAFSLERIGRRPADTADAVKSNFAGTGALRFASRAAAFLLVASVAVSVTGAAVYLMQLP